MSVGNATTVAPALPTEEAIASRVRELCRLFDEDAHLTSRLDALREAPAGSDLMRWVRSALIARRTADLEANRQRRHALEREVTSQLILLQRGGSEPNSLDPFDKRLPGYRQRLRVLLAELAAVDRAPAEQRDALRERFDYDARGLAEVVRSYEHAATQRFVEHVLAEPQPADVAPEGGTQ
jgi:hypothetical protein